MARKPRLEFEGAIYHVINRGNYRKDLFNEKGAAEAFERTLFEACEKCGWVVHAYVLMSNHYHLALETPEANLVQGMAWLQGTFANRFNRFRGERGHVFQSRYQSILIEEGRPCSGWSTTSTSTRSEPVWSRCPNWPVTRFPVTQNSARNIPPPTSAGPASWRAWSFRIPSPA
jgi:REP element-mobilizing transposase RayT